MRRDVGMRLQSGFTLHLKIWINDVHALYGLVQNTMETVNNIARTLRDEVGAMRMPFEIF